jgi:hypothetical protein
VSTTSPVKAEVIVVRCGASIHAPLMYISMCDLQKFDGDAACSTKELE